MKAKGDGAESITLIMNAITPYWEHKDKAVLYCADAAQMPLADASIDLTVTSPPYDNLRKYNGYTFDFEAIARELWRVTKPGGVVVWVVGDATINGSETGTSFRQALFFKDVCGFNLETMIYEIAGTGAKGSNYYYWQAFEFMFVLSKGTPKTAHRIADVRNCTAGQKRGFSPKSALLGTRQDRIGKIAPEWSVRPNVWRYAVGQNDDTAHPAPFPEALARDHILSWSNPGDTVLDCFAGSGTTGKMAIINNRRSVNLEISAEYCDIAKARMMRALGKPCDMPRPVPVNEYRPLLEAQDF